MSYINPENALKHAQEFKAEGNIEGALEELHSALHGKKFKGNNIILERIMVSLILTVLFRTIISLLAVVLTMPLLL
jgi:hypothetical protein